MSELQSGTVESIHIAPRAEEDTDAVESVAVVAGRGIEGDRYFRTDGSGTFHEADKHGQDLTLIEAEAIEGLAADTGIELAPGESRRNVVTRGVALNDLVGRRFTVGEVEAVGNRLCDPCNHLEKLTRPGVLKGLVERGGLRADVVRGGAIRVGDEVRELGPV
ncbi:MAG: MOSC domain-containing protein [Solirubrobacterales bacterium]